MKNKHVPCAGEPVIFYEPDVPIFSYKSTFAVQIHFALLLLEFLVELWFFYSMVYKTPLRIRVKTMTFFSLLEFF